MTAKRDAPKKEAAEEPVEKKLKVEAKSKESNEDAKDIKDETIKEEAGEAQELEKDAPKDTRAALKESIEFHRSETTLNVIPTTGGRILSALSDGGMQYLIAGARANVGLKAGRYMFEVKVIEALNPVEGGGRGRVPLPRQLVRVGFSTSSCPLVVGETDDGVCFDSEGFFLADKRRLPLSQRLGRDQTLAVVLNLDPKSPNANTVSAFRDGRRISAPQKLPEALLGKPLYPHVSFRNVTLQVHFGPQPLAPLPFRCSTVQEAAAADVSVTKSTAPKEGKYEVVFPVGYPDEGTFHWLDEFLKKNPSFVELSDRKILQWAAQSGIWKPKSNSFKNSGDKPDFNFGIPAMDDLSIRRVLSSIASVVPRNFVVMEVKQNLCEADRKENLKRFSAGFYNKVAHVVMGEPNDDYKATVRDILLQEKQKKVEADWQAKKLEKERKKHFAERQKQLLELQKKRKEEEEARRKEAEKKLKEEKGQSEDDAEMKQEEDTGEQPGKEAKDADMQEDAVKQEAKEEKKEEQEEEKAGDDDTPPKVELTEEEKAVHFRPQQISDLTNHIMSTSFAQFTIPSKEEGFDELRFEWQGEEKSKEYLNKCVQQKKISARIEDLQPSEWFKTKSQAWQKVAAGWQAKQKEWKDASKSTEEGEEKEEEVDKADDLDIFSVEDVTNVGSGEPLFSSFTLEDWALLTLRYELYLLVEAYRRDVNDPERLGIHESHTLFYYSRYYRRQLNPKYYGKESVRELLDLVKDSVSFDKVHNILAKHLTEEQETPDIFLKLTEEHRRERQRRIDAGDETARLKFAVQVLHPHQQAGSPSQGSSAGVPAPCSTSSRGIISPGMVSASRSGIPSWSQPSRAAQWQGGKANSRWPQTYAPRQAYGGRWRSGQ